MVYKLYLIIAIALFLLTNERILCCVVPGTSFQAARGPDKEENVVAEHENKADSAGDLDCPDSHHSIVYLWWLQMLKMIYLHFFGGYTYQVLLYGFWLQMTVSYDSACIVFSFCIIYNFLTCGAIPCYSFATRNVLG
jgi:hypothetical protein